MDTDQPQDYRPVISLYQALLYPHEIALLKLESLPNRNALFSLNIPDGEVIIVFYPEAPRKGHEGDVLPIAVEARILSHVKAGREREEVTVQGLRRVNLDQLIPVGDMVEGWSSPFDQALISPLEESEVTHQHILSMNKVMRLYEKLSKKGSHFPQDRFEAIRSLLDHPERMIDMIAQVTKMDRLQSISLMREPNTLKRLEVLHDWMVTEQERGEIALEVERRTKIDIEESRREYYLRQQMRTIRKELGEDDHSADEADRYEEQLKTLDLDEDSSQEVNREIQRLRHIQPSSSEFQVIKTFLDRFFALPWNNSTEEMIDLPKVRQSLEEEHFGLSKVKERILEFLAVRKLNPKHKGPILCFAGPPGVGKTSLGRSIAEAIGRRFFRISVGGVKDEAEVRGHRRTYVGAMPGKIMNALARVKCNNPLLMLDEIDKIGSDHRGDPASALLEVLDPEQNDTFTDHYFNVPFDLSGVMFVVTANYLHDIPKPLLDRLEVISIEGYTETEKVEIARAHLTPKILDDHGISDTSLSFEELGVRHLIRGWTREAGVRNLQRALQKVCRKVAREFVEAQEETLKISTETLPKYLGPKRFIHNEGVGESVIGSANGLAWTSSGGEILVIETLKMKGNGKLVITGKLGEVMRESVQAAHSFIRSRAETLHIDISAFEESDLHIHFPAGAVPKDGPSAGVTVTLALASLLSGLPIRSDIAMTGEVTLRGKVLAVGGIKDKVLAAYRAGLLHVALPEANIKDIEELPDEVKEVVSFHPLAFVDDLFELALINFSTEMTRLNALEEETFVDEPFEDTLEHLALQEISSPASDDLDS